MKTKAVSKTESGNFELMEVELPELKSDDILLKVNANSLSLKSYSKLKNRGRSVKNRAKEVHRISGEIVKVGTDWEERFSVGDKITLSQAVNLKDSTEFQGRLYENCGGNCTFVIIPGEVIREDNLQPFRKDGFFSAALTEIYSSVIGACRSLYRTDRQKHSHYLGIKEGGNMAIIGGCGSTGFAAIDYALSGEFRPAQLFVTDIDDAKLKRAQAIFGKKAESRGVSLLFINTVSMKNPYETIMRLTENKGFDDILVMIPETSALEFAEKLVGFNGCLNFYAEPENKKLSAKVNYRDIHNMEKHIIGTNTGNIDDLKEALLLIEQNLLSPEVLVSHIGGLDAVIDVTDAPVGKNLIYTGVAMPLTALDDLKNRAKESELYKNLAELVRVNNGLWSVEAEKYLLANGTAI